MFARFLLVPALLWLATVASTQSHQKGVAGVSATNGQVFLFDQSTVASMSVGAAASYGCVMDRTNTELLVTTSAGTVQRVDPKNASVLGTLARGLPALLDIAIDQNGDHYVSSMSNLWKIDRFGNVASTSIALVAPWGGMTIDIDTGDLIVQSASGANFYPTLRVARDGSAVTTLGTGADARYGIAQHIPTGDVYIGACCGDFPLSANMYVLRAGFSVATVWLNTVSPPVGCYSVKADRSSAATQRLLIGAYKPLDPRRGPGGWYTIDINNKSVNTVATLNVSLHECEYLYRRNIYGLKTGTGRWVLGIAIPEDASSPFVLAVTLAGVRPGLDLSDGRKISLNPDNLTFLSAQGLLAPYLTGNRGTLDTNGTASARLNLSSLGPSANGVTLHFIAVTLDKNAPLGFKTIVDPFVLKIEGL